MQIICNCELFAITLQRKFKTMNIGNRIRDTGLKVTPQRKKVYEVISELAHASVEDIITHVQQQNPEITVSTIYRILNSFHDSNLLGKITFHDGKVYYDINSHEHHHIINSNHTLIDIDDSKLSDLIRERVKEQIGDEQIEMISIQVTTKQKD